jgi:trehalose-phosphatase
MGMYVERLDGSCIDRRESSVVFDFSDCSDNQYGHMIAKELYKHIETLIANGFQIQRVFGQTYVEVKPLELKKSLVLERILSAITVYRKKVDFLLYIGDDSSNEEVFSCLRSY